MSINNVLTISFSLATSSCLFPLDKPSDCAGTKRLETKDFPAWCLDTCTLSFLTLRKDLVATSFKSLQCKPLKQGNLSSEDKIVRVDSILASKKENLYCSPSEKTTYNSQIRLKVQCGSFGNYDHIWKFYKIRKTCSFTTTKSLNSIYWGLATCIIFLPFLIALTQVYFSSLQVCQITRLITSWGSRVCQSFVILG